MLGKHTGIPVAELPKRPRRALNLREQERHRPGRQLEPHHHDPPKPSPTATPRIQTQKRSNLRPHLVRLHPDNWLKRLFGDPTVRCAQVRCDPRLERCRGAMPVVCGFPFLRATLRRGPNGP